MKFGIKPMAFLRPVAFIGREKEIPNAHSEKFEDIKHRTKKISWKD
jgi:hypothetical protein